MPASEETSRQRGCAPPAVDLTEAKEHKKLALIDLAERLANTKDVAEQQRLKEELARMTFGE